MKTTKDKDFWSCFEMVADLWFPGYLMIVGSSGGEIPDEHYIKSIKVFDPTKKEE